MVVLAQTADLGLREELSEQLAAFNQRPQPAWLKNGRLSDDIWVVELDNPEIRRHPSGTIRFDVPVGPGRSLTAPAELRDLLTAKKYVYFAITGPNAWVRSSATIAEEYRGFLALLRWRNERGLPSMADLTRSWFEEFCESLEHSGLEGLVRSEAAARTIVEECRRLGHSPPVQNTAPKCFSLSAAVRLAGFDSPQQISDPAAAVFARWATDEGLSLPRSLEGRVSRKYSRLEYRGQSLERYTRVWERLGRLSTEMNHDPVGYSPFRNRAESVRLASGMGTPLSRTPTPPSAQICFLIDRALRWVLFYSEDLITLVQRTREIESNLNRPPRRDRRARIAQDIWRGPDIVHSNKHDALGAPDIGIYTDSLNNDVQAHLQNIYLRLLPAACAIVIAAFTARRAEEILSLRDDCILELNDEIWLRTYIAKTLRGRDRIPATQAVVKAVDILKWLSATARQSSSSSWLFQLHDPHTPSAQIFAPTIRRSLTAFAKAMEVPPLTDGSKWSFSPHQFRRFFAIIYYYRYRDRSLAALSQYLLHYDPDSTRTYVTEARVGGFLKMVDQARVDIEQARRTHTIETKRRETFEEVALEFRTEIYRGALEGREALSGWAGRRVLSELQKAKADWDAKVEIGDFGEGRPSLDAFLIEFARPRRLEPHGQGHSYCSCTNSEADLSIAGCVVEARHRDPTAQVRQGPDLRFAADAICAACPHNFQLAENRQYWADLARTARTTCGSCPGTVLSAKMAERLKIAEEHLSRFHGGIG